MINIFWNHRICQYVEEDTENTIFSIREVYYDSDDGRIIGWTVNDIRPYGETLEELRENLEWMLAAMDKPVLIESELLAEMEAREPEPEEEYETYDSVEEFLASLEED